MNLAPAAVHMHDIIEDTLSNKLLVLNLIKRIAQSRQSISISVAGQQQSYLSSLLKVNVENRKLIFDEPNPAAPENLLHPGTTLSLSLKLDNLPVHFTTKVESIDDSEKYISFQTPFPETIYYPQHRKYYRLRTEFSNAVKAVILMPETKIECEVIDISIHGLQLRLPYSFLNTFVIEQELDDIYLSFEDGQSLSVSSEVRNINIEEKKSAISLRLHILDAGQRVEKFLQRFINHMETQQATK